MPSSSSQRLGRRARVLARRALLALQPLSRGARLSVPAWRLFERILVLVDRSSDPSTGSDGLALPPRRLRVRVIAQTDPEVFIASGASNCRQIAELAEANGLAIDEVARVLDFGCGCGRVSRHWAGYAGLEIHGSDHDAELVAWVDEHLPFVAGNVNDLAPPLPYADGHFGLVYAISVFTHLTKDLGEAWMRELHRVIRPGGLLLFSVLAERNLDRLRPREREAYDRGELVVQFDDAPGTNLCIGYHPEAYLDSLTVGFERVARVGVGMQDMCVARRLPAPVVAA